VHVRHLFFEGNRLVDLRLTKHLGKAKGKNAGEQAHQHAANQ